LTINWGNWLIGGCCALFIAVIVTPTGVYVGAWKLMCGRDAAAWVQAIGSIAAILTAVGVAAYQNHSEVARRRIERNTATFIRVSAAMWAADMAAAAVSNVPTVLRSADKLPAIIEFGFPAHTFEDAAANIDRLPFHEFEVAEIAIKLAVLRLLVRGTQERAGIVTNLLRRGDEITDAMWKDLDSRSRDAVEQCNFIHEFMHETYGAASDFSSNSRGD
jgi:hypothetical protein